MIYEIYEGNMERLMKKLNTIKNKCSKLGCEFLFEEVGETYRNVKDSETGELRTNVRFIQVETSGIAKIDDWEFVATIEHKKPINIIRSFRPEVLVPEYYYTADTRCDHCGTARNRKDTYLIRNTQTGEFKQVGKSCLKEFTKGLSAEAVASYISWFNEFIKGEIPTGSLKSYYSVHEIMELAVEAVRLYGFNKVDGFGESTKLVVTEQLHQWGKYQKRIDQDGFNVDRPGNKEQASEILAWVAALPVEYGYVSNLKAACSNEMCESRDIGIIVSAVASYNRAAEKKERIARQKLLDESSQWVGTEGDRIEIRNVKCKLLTSWDTEFGYTYLYKFTDTQGNVFTWKTGKWLGYDHDCEEQLFTLKGTIKAHTEFRGVRQTELTRCKVLSSELIVG